MKYELSTEVIKILDDLAERFGIAIDWTSDNVMPYLTELFDRFITYKIVMHTMPILLFVIGVIGLYVSLSKYFKYNKLIKTTGENNLFFYKCQHWNYTTNEPTIFNYVTVYGFGALTIASALSLIFIDIGSLLQLVFVPELYMFEYLSQNIGG